MDGLLTAILHSPLALFIAAAISVTAVGEGYAHVDRRSRRLRRLRAKQLPRSDAPVELLREDVRPTALLAAASEPGWFKACQDDLTMEDREAGKLQTRYHGSVARCIAVLTVGAILVCVSAIIVRGEPTLEKFVANFDLLATIYALSFFIVARISNRVFVAHRSFIETLRAWIHLALIFPLERPASTVTEAYPATKAAASARVRKDPKRPARDADRAQDHGDREVPIYKRVERYWTDLQTTCRNSGLRQPSTAADLGFYLKARPLEQLNYFVIAQWRIHEGQKWREGAILVLYASSVILAVLKTLHVFGPDFPTLQFATWLPVDVIAAALLAVMVLSAAATSSLISRNERSLLHSYHAQERRIRKWFEMFAVISGSADKKQLVETILSFEDIMLNDLLDFIHITSRDVIETPGF
jgi:hypothetical protein